MQFDHLSYPVENFVDVQIEHDGQTLTLANFHFPSEIARDSPDYQGILFYVHGYSDNSSRQINLAINFAKKGFDFFSMDHRGHGQSEGYRCLVTDVNDSADEQIQFHLKAIDKYMTMHNLEEVPKVYVLAHSFGGMVMLNAMLRNKHILADGRSLYTKVCCVAPFWGHPRYDFFMKIMPIMRLVRFISGGHEVIDNKNLPIDKIEDHMMHWQLDRSNRLQQKQHCAGSIINFVDQITEFDELIKSGEIKDAAKHLPPLFLFLAAKDEEICNASAKKVFEHLPIEDKQMHVEQDVGHQLFSHGIFMPQAVEKISDWFKAEKSN